MSLKLNDVKKSTKPKSTEKYPVGTWAKSETARPWSDSGLNKDSGTRRRSLASDAVMSDEWSTMHAEPVLGIESEDSTRLSRVYRALTNLEDRIERATQAPRFMLKRFLPTR